MFTLASLAPVIVNTSENVITRFTPLQRDCYNDDEFHLKAFNWDDGFRYSMTNCLYAALFEKIIQNCSCVPNYFSDFNENNLTKCRYVKKQFGSLNLLFCNLHKYLSPSILISEQKWSVLVLVLSDMLAYSHTEIWVSQYWKLSVSANIYAFITKKQKSKK